MKQEQLQGVLCINKPPEFTSFDVIGKLRGILRMRRLGHTGTLDPMAIGVLPVLVGAATKACDILPNQTKRYRASVRFGIETDTEDIWGTKTAEYPQMHVTRRQLEHVLPQFVGTIEQLPPMYSAVSVNGTRLYELARKGITVNRPRRTVEIYDIALESWDEHAQTAVLSIFCGKGTYIRTLLADLGRALGGGAVMMALCRTQAGDFTLEQCVTLEEVQALCESGTLEAHLISTERLFAALPALYLDERLSGLYRNGVKFSLEQLSGILPDQQTYRVYDAAGMFLGTANVNREERLLRVGKNFR